MLMLMLMKKTLLTRALMLQTQHRKKPKPTLTAEDK
jgi:hypothetical protein